MIYVITTQQHKDIFKFLESEYGYTTTILAVQMFSLKEFFESSSNFDICQYIFIDITAINDSEEEFIKAINKFTNLNYSKIIIYSRYIDKYKSYIEILIQNHFYNIFHASKIKDFKDKVLYSLDNNFSKKQALQIINEDIKTIVFNKTPLLIALAGSINRIGTTTTAINLADVLTSYDLEVCYVEYNYNNHLKSILESINARKIDGIYVYRGISFFTAEDAVIEGYDVYIYDMGVIDENKIDEFIDDLNEFDKLFVLNGTKPYEIKSIDLNNLKCSVSNLYNFTNNLDKTKDIKKLSFCADFFDNDINEDLYLEELKDFMA